MHGPIIKDVIGAARCVTKSAPMAACVFVPIAKVGATPCVTKTCSWRPRCKSPLSKTCSARCVTKRVPTAAYVHVPIIKDVLGAAQCVTKSAPRAAYVHVPIGKDVLTSSSKVRGRGDGTRELCSLYFWLLLRFICPSLPTRAAAAPLV